MTTHATDLESLWHSHYAKLRAYIRRHIFDDDAIDDLVSSVYLRALVAIRNGHGYVVSASGWLWQIARSVILDYMRQTKRRVSITYIDDLGELMAAGTSLDEQVERAIVVDEVQQAVARLPEAQAAVMTQRLYGYELPEIAVNIGKSYEATKQLQQRAYGKLRQSLPRKEIG